MKTTSPLLSHLSRSIPNAVPEAEDTDIDIESDIQNVAQIPFPLDGAAGTSNSVQQNGTLHVSNTSNVNAASGEVLTLLATLSKGLYEFNVNGSFSSNYFTLNFFEHYMYLLSPSGIIIPLLGFQCGGAAAAPTVQTAVRRVIILLPSDNWTVRIQARNNAAAQNANSAWSAVINRLL